MSVAAFWPYDGVTGAHPFLPHVFVVHFVGIAALAAFCLYAFVFRPGVPPAAAEPYFAALPAGTRGRSIHLLLSAAFVLYLMNGLLDIRLFPMMPVLPQPSLERLLYALVIVCSPLAGWLLDRSPETVVRRIMPVCCWLFILSPAMAALGIGHGLHDILQTVAAAAQFVTYVVITLALTGLAQKAALSGFLASIMYSMWMVLVLGYTLFRRGLGLDTGTTVLMATVLALLFHLLLRRVDFVVADGQPTKALPATQAATPVPTPETGIRAMVDFLDGAGLTPREREVTELLFRGSATRDIAASLGISENTAKKHIRGVLRKFGAASRHDLFARYLAATRAPATEDGITRVTHE